MAMLIPAEQKTYNREPEEFSRGQTHTHTSKQALQIKEIKKKLTVDL